MRAIAFAAIVPALLIGSLLGSGAARAAGPFDGVYKGGNFSTGGAGRCPPGTNFEIPVRDSEFTWRVPGDAPKIKIGADGSFSGQSGPRYINGRIAGTTMTANTTGTACNYSWTLTK